MSMQGKREFRMLLPKETLKKLCDQSEVHKTTPQRIVLSLIEDYVARNCPPDPDDDDWGNR